MVRPSRRADRILFGDAGETVRALHAEVAVPGRHSRVSPEWRERFHAANELAWRVVDEDLESSGMRHPTEGEVARSVVECLPRDSILFLGR